MIIGFKELLSLIHDWLQIFIWFVSSRLKSETEKDLEILALRSQLSLLQQNLVKRKYPKSTPTHAFRQLWVLLSKILSNWKSSLFIIKPETVVGWHRKAFKLYWKNKSKRVGRPQISAKTIALIKRIHKENPLLSPEKIHERLKALSIIDVPSPNSIAKYIPKLRKPPTQRQIQSWHTFLENHRNKIWAMDFFVVPTLYFQVLYVFILISHDRRKIEHFAVTTTPHSAWVAQQIREATPYQNTPAYIIHDNDTTFTSNYFQSFLANCNIKSKKTSFRSPWQNGICERAIGILRQELLNHIIPLNQKHLEFLLREYISEYYNPVRTHQGIDCKTPIISESILEETLIENTTLIKKPILNGLYHGYKKAA